MGKTPDSQGTYADYVELLKLYDKNQNGTMMLAELDNILCNLGDEIPKEDEQKTMAAWNFAEENLTTAITLRCHKTTSETTKTSRSAQPPADPAPQSPSKARRSLEDLH